MNMLWKNTGNYESKGLRSVPGMWRMSEETTVPAVMPRGNPTSVGLTYASFLYASTNW